MKNSDFIPASTATSAYITEKEAANILGISAKTLQKWRWLGIEAQPKYKKFGRLVRYSLADITEYAEKSTIQNYR